AGHLCAQILRDLHSKGTDSSRRPVDEDFLPRLNLSVITQTLQCSETCDRYTSSLLKRDVRRLHRYCPIRAWAKILGKSTDFIAKHFITGFELRYVLAHGFNRARVINA